MKTNIILSAVFVAACVCSLPAETIKVAAGETVRPTKALTGGVLVKEGPGMLDLSLTALKNEGLVIREGAVRFAVETGSEAKPVTTRHLRWTISATRPNAQYSGSGPQFSEFRLFYKGQPVAFPSTTVSTSVNHQLAEGADKGFDGDLKTKCFQRAPFILDFGTKVTFDSYSFATANDAIGRDPRDWVLEVGEKKNGRVYWTTAGVERGFTAPTARFAEVGKKFLVRPGGSFPLDYPIEVEGKGRLLLDGVGGRFDKLSGSGLIELKNSSIVFPPNSTFTGTVIGGSVNYEPKRPF